MNELIFAKYFDVSIHLAHEFAKSKDNSIHKYQVVWLINNKLVAADAFIYQKDAPIKITADSEWSPTEKNMYWGNSNEDFPTNVRIPFFKKFDVPFSSFTELYKNSSLLFDEISSFVKELKITDNANTNNIFYNVKFLGNDINLDFLQLDGKDKIIPVSLIKVSEN